MRRDQQKQIDSMCSKHTVLIWSRSANSHTGPRHLMAANEAGQMSAPDHAHADQKTSCFSRGVHR